MRLADLAAVRVAEIRREHQHLALLGLANVVGAEELRPAAGHVVEIEQEDEVAVDGVAGRV